MVSFSIILVPRRLALTLLVQGLAYITDFKTANRSQDLVPVACKPISPETCCSLLTEKTVTSTAAASFAATPNVTAPVSSNATANPPFTNATFFVPGADSSSHQVGFATNSTIGGFVTSGFAFYGQMAVLERSDGSWMSLFWAVPTSTLGIWSMTWNETGTEDGVVPVTLKSMPPANLMTEVVT
jgi:hypothetical protein